MYVCEFGHWVCGESWCYEQSLTHHPQFSRLESGVLLLYMCYISIFHAQAVCTSCMGCEVCFLSFFLS